MSNYAVMPLADYQAICDATRAQTGGTDLLKSGDVAAAIAGIAPVLEPITITENGEHTPGEGVDGFSRIVANVEFGWRDALSERLANTLTEYSNEAIESIAPYGFYYCSALTKIDVPKVITVGEGAFNGVTQLEEYNFESLRTIGKNGFFGVPLGDITDDNFPALYEIGQYGLRTVSATKIVKPGSTLKIHGVAFEGNELLKKVDIWAAEWGAGNQALLFWRCPMFDTFIIRRTDMVNPWCGWSGAFNSTPIAAGTGYIYVPAALVDAYKAATGWADWAEQIRAIEDYPEITGG